MIELVLILIIIASIGYLIILLYPFFVGKVSQSQSIEIEKNPKYSKKLTSDQDVNDLIKKNYKKIEAIKRKGKNRTPQDNQWLKEIAMAVIKHNIITRELNCNQLFATLFCVNYTWKNSKGENKNKLRDLKNYLQRVIILYHGNEINKTKINTGKFAGCWEIKKGTWSTHVPKHVFENGHLDRAGKKNPRL